MKLLFSLLLLGNALFCLGQFPSTHPTIVAFRNDLLTEVPLYKPDTLTIDSLLLIREKYPAVRLIKTFTKNKNVVYYDYYYNGTTLLENACTYDTLETLIGLSQQYNEKGVLEYTLDYDKGGWVVHNKKDFPFLALQNNMQLKADSLVSKIYSRNFLKKHTAWNVGSSSMYNDNESGNWTDKFKDKPTKFLFRYDIILDDEHKYNHLIEFELNENGAYTPDEDEYLHGFENVPDSLKGGFKLTYKGAIAKAKNLGLTENDSRKAVGMLHWESHEHANGHFRFDVMIRTKTVKTIVTEGRSSQTVKYIIYSFNPWTGDFIEKKSSKALTLYIE